jgi:glycolate oxidase FAD binding subunit
MIAMDPALEALQTRIRKAAQDSTPLRIRGGGSKDFYGGPPLGDILETQIYAGIVEYDPTELVITARAGTSLAAIESAMRARGQMLAFEPPHYGEGSTLGGAVASGLSGPRRPYAGAVRDLVLGVRILDGTGQDLSFGGRVMKNVAGFDVARLMTGALGTLGVITEISLKCLPLPKSESTLAFECSADEAIRMVNQWGTQPLPLSATCFHRGRMRVRLSGAQPAVAAAVAKLSGEKVPDADGYWASLRDHTHPFFAEVRAAGAPLWR